MKKSPSLSMKPGETIVLTDISLDEFRYADYKSISPIGEQVLLLPLVRPTEPVLSRDKTLSAINDGKRDSFVFVGGYHSDDHPHGLEFPTIFFPPQAEPTVSKVLVRWHFRGPDSFEVVSAGSLSELALAGWSVQATAKRDDYLNMVDIVELGQEVYGQHVWAIRVPLADLPHFTALADMTFFGPSLQQVQSRAGIGTDIAVSSTSESGTLPGLRVTNLRKDPIDLIAVSE